MVFMARLARAAQAWRSVSSSRIPAPRCMLLPHHLPRLYRCTLSIGLGPFKDHFQTNVLGDHWPRSTSESSSSFSVFPSILAGLFGAGLLDTAYADAKEEPPKAALPSEHPSNYFNLEELARKERHRLEELLKSKGMKYGSYPRFTVGVKGQKVTIKFKIPPTCEIPQLIASLVSHLGMRVEGHGSGSDMMLRAWDSSVAWQLSLSNPEKQEGNGMEQWLPGCSNESKGDLCILIFHSLIGSDKAEIEFLKEGSFGDRELDALVHALQLAGEKTKGNKTVERKSVEDASAEKSVSSLEALGVRVFGLDAPHVDYSDGEMSWDNIAGYDEQKREIEDTVLLALQSPEVYDDIAHGTRHKFEPNRPRALLLEGPPGTGKTSCARVVALQAGVPLLYVPLEVVMSKYYGESERLLSKVFSHANEFPNGAIVFLDEIDSFAITRDTHQMHEATRRILSVLLQQIDGFEQDKKVIVIAATNRKQDLDPALMSRFDSMIFFGLPDEQTREAIAAQYAKHLMKSELLEFAQVTEGMSGRDIRDVCQQAERRWASKIIRGQASKDGDRVRLPPLQEYIESALNRQRSMLGMEKHKFEPWKQSQLDLL